MNIVGIGIGLGKRVTDLFLKHLLYDWTHDRQQDRLGNAEEKFVIGLFDLDLQILDVDRNLVHLGEMLTIFLVSSGGSNLEAEAITTKIDVHNTSVGDGWKPLLFFNVIRDILQIHLNTRGGDHDLVVTLVANLFTAPSKVIVTAEFNDIWRQVVALDD